MREARNMKQMGKKNNMNFLLRTNCVNRANELASSCVRVCVSVEQRVRVCVCLLRVRVYYRCTNFECI